MLPNRVLAISDRQKAFTNVQNMSTVEMFEKNNGNTCLRLRVYCKTCDRSHKKLRFVWFHCLAVPCPE